jgi:hypothetical protein
MSSLGDAIDKRRAQRAPAPPPTDGAGLGEPNGSGPHSARSELRRRRDELAEQVTELHWDLGGLAYEMATRDYFRLDVLVRRAAVLQERDAELAELERLLALEDSASAGTCPGCHAPHSRGALFCWQCGATLMQRAPSSAMPALGLPRAGAHDDSATTDAMDALLAPQARNGDASSERSDRRPFSDGAPRAED